MAAERNITFHTAHDMTAVDSDSERWVLLTSNVVFMLLALPDGSGAFHPPRRSCVHLVQPGPSQSPCCIRLCSTSRSGILVFRTRVDKVSRYTDRTMAELTYRCRSLFPHTPFSYTATPPMLLEVHAAARGRINIASIDVADMLCRAFAKLRRAFRRIWTSASLVPNRAQSVRGREAST